MKLYKAVILALALVAVSGCSFEEAKAILMFDGVHVPTAKQAEAAAPTVVQQAPNPNTTTADPADVQTALDSIDDLTSVVAALATDVATSDDAKATREAYDDGVSAGLETRVSTLEQAAQIIADRLAIRPISPSVVPTTTVTSHTPGTSPANPDLFTAKTADGMTIYLFCTQMPSFPGAPVIPGPDAGKGIINLGGGYYVVPPDAQHKQYQVLKEYVPVVVTATSKPNNGGGNSATNTAVPGATQVPTQVPSSTMVPSSTPRPTYTALPTDTTQPGQPTNTPRPTYTPYPTNTEQATYTPYPTDTVQATYTPQPTNTALPTYTSQPTSTPRPTFTALPTDTDQPGQPTNTPRPTFTPYPTYTDVPTFTPWPTYTPRPTNTALPTYTDVPTSTPSASATATSTGTVATPVNTPTVTVTDDPYPGPETATPTPTETPHPCEIDPTSIECECECAVHPGSHPRCPVATPTPIATPVKACIPVSDWPNTQTEAVVMFGADFGRWDFGAAADGTQYVHLSEGFLPSNPIRTQKCVTEGFVGDPHQFVSWMSEIWTYLLDRIAESPTTPTLGLTIWNSQLLSDAEMLYCIGEARIRNLPGWVIDPIGFNPIMCVPTPVPTTLAPPLAQPLQRASQPQQQKRRAPGPPAEFMVAPQLSDSAPAPVAAPPAAPVVAPEAPPPATVEEQWGSGSFTAKDLVLCQACDGEIVIDGVFRHWEAGDRSEPCVIQGHNGRNAWRIARTPEQEAEARRPQYEWCLPGILSHP